MKAAPLLSDHPDCQSQGAHPQLMPEASAYTHGPGRLSGRREHGLRAQLGLPASFPSPPLTGQGGRAANVPRPGAKDRSRRVLARGCSYIQRPLELAEASRAPLGGRPPGRGTERGRGRAGATIGRGGQRSVGEPGRRGGKEVAATAVHQPRSAGGRMPLGAQSGVGGRGAGTRVPTPPLPAPLDPQGTPAPTAASRAPLGPRRLPAPTSLAP